jgi:hypothetical protein
MTLQHRFLHFACTLLRFRQWMWGVVVVALLCIFLALIRGPVSVNFTWGPSVGFCSAAYVELQNRTLVPLSTEGWWFGDRSTHYYFPRRWLLPLQSVRLWPGTGADDILNVYAGGVGTSWEMNTATVRGLPQDLFITASCDIFP